jgi:hypothetical protein
VAKTIPSQPLIGRQGESLVSARANAMGLLFSSYGPLEAGIDGLIEMRDPVTGVVSGRLVAAQVKTRTGGAYPGETADGFHYLMDDEDIAYWRGANVPVIVVLVRLHDGSIYWKPAPKTGRRIDIDKHADEMTPTARAAIEALSIEKLRFGAWLPAPRTADPARLNLLRVIPPAVVHLGPSAFQRGGAAVTELLKQDGHPPMDWIISGGRFVSFRDPRTCGLKRIVDVGALDALTPADFVAAGLDEQYVMTDLMRRALQQQFDQELGFEKEQRALYFLADRRRIERVYDYQSLKRPAKADVVKRYTGKKGATYVRHHAFEPRFLHAQDDWYLAVTPTYVFTRDGFQHDAFAGQRIAGKKRLERNPAILGQFLMWSHLLCTRFGVAPETALFSESSALGAALRFEPIAPIAFDRAVPDEHWLATEPDPEEMKQAAGALL